MDIDDDDEKSQKYKDSRDAFLEAIKIRQNDMQANKKHIEEKGVPEELLSTMQAIKERKQALEELRQSRCEQKIMKC